MCMTFIAITLNLIDKIWVEEERERERGREVSTWTVVGLYNVQKLDGSVNI